MTVTDFTIAYALLALAFIAAVILRALWRVAHNAFMTALNGAAEQIDI